jgi:glyoxylase-like metal-dependent hydrolase (beta-lactamase superfamily II)
MASLKKRLPANVPGPFFVDASCIDCDACRWIAPRTYGEAGDQSFVRQQPEGREERRAALLALVACPTGSIGVEPGSVPREELAWAREAYPVPIDGAVHHAGYHSEKSFGAASYFVRRADGGLGNLLVDSPRFSSALAGRLEELGGAGTLFLTHVDDVADHARWRERLGARRVIHAGDARGELRRAEVVIEGIDPVELDRETLLIPVPGHTKGSTCLLWRERYLFTGDHLAWSERLGHPYAFRSACWYDWGELVRSMERLARFRFEWILPGHGRRCHLPADEMRRQMQRCLDWMRVRSQDPPDS